MRARALPRQRGPRNVLFTDTTAAPIKARVPLPRNCSTPNEISRDYAICGKHAKRVPIVVPGRRTDASGILAQLLIYDLPLLSLSTTSECMDPRVKMKRATCIRNFRYVKRNSVRARKDGNAEIGCCEDLFFEGNRLENRPSV